MATLALLRNTEFRVALQALLHRGYVFPSLDFGAFLDARMAITAFYVRVLHVRETHIGVFSPFPSGNLHLDGGMAGQACLGRLFPVEVMAGLAGALRWQTRCFLLCGAFVASVAGKLHFLDVLLMAENEVRLLRSPVYLRG